MFSKKVGLMLSGYTLVESVVAIGILSLSIFLSIQLLSSPMLGQSHYALVDIEHVADSLSALAQQGRVKDRLTIHRSWGLMVADVTNNSAYPNSVIVEMYALTHLGTRIIVSKRLYETTNKH